MKKLLFLFITAIALLSCDYDPVEGKLTGELKSQFQYQIKQPRKLYLINMSTNASSYIWDFGDGNKSYEENPVHQYNSKGVYKVKLTAKNGSKSDVSEATVTITDPTKCYITGITYNKVGKENKYYRAVLKDDDLFTTTWFSTNYKLLSSANLPFDYNFSSPVLMDGLSGDNYYTLYVYWADNTSSDGTQILKQKIQTSQILSYAETIKVTSDNADTQVVVKFAWK